MNCIYCGHQQTPVHNTGDDEPCDETCSTCIRLAKIEEFEARIDEALENGDDEAARAAVAERAAYRLSGLDR